MGEKCRFREAGDAVTDESTGLWVYHEGGGSGDEKLATSAENKRKKEANYNQGSCKHKAETVEKRKRSISEEGNEVQKQQHKKRSGR